MQLLYKPDWEQTKEHFEAWWKREDLGRCALAVTAPQDGSRGIRPPEFPKKVEDRWLDFDWLHEINEYRMKTTFYGGEAFPVWNAGYPGWECIQTFLGCPIDLGEETGWIHPIIADGELTDHDYRKFVIKPDNRWWSFLQAVERFAVEDSKDKAIPGLQDLGSSGDTLAAMRGTENLLMDLLDCPDYVREFDLYLTRLWFEVYETVYQITRTGAEGSTSWINFWSPGKYYNIQNDLSYMISPKTFIDVFLPSIELQVQYLDHIVYHVDGVNAFVHVDALCDIPGLQALQILPGDGKPSPLYYMDVLKKVQAKGKNLFISLPPHEVETALEMLSSRGLFISTVCDTREEAEYLLRMAEKWSRFI